MERSYFLLIDGQQVGPLTLKEALRRPVVASTLVWFEGLSGWVAASTLEEFKEMVSRGPAPSVAPASDPSPMVAERWGTATQPNVRGPVDGWADQAQLAAEIEKYHQFAIAFLLSFIGTAISAAVFVGLFSESRSAGVTSGIIGVFVAVAFLVLHLVYFCKFHYRCWCVANARTGSQEVSPTQAVGLLFVPVFNIYWYFRSYSTLSQMLAKAIQPLDYDPHFRPSTSTAQALCILNVVSVIPYIGTLISLVNLIIWFIVVGQNKRAAVHLLRAIPA